MNHQFPYLIIIFLNSHLKHPSISRIQHILILSLKTKPLCYSLQLYKPPISIINNRPRIRQLQLLCPQNLICPLNLSLLLLYYFPFRQQHLLLLPQLLLRREQSSLQALDAILVIDHDEPASQRLDLSFHIWRSWPLSPPLWGFQNLGAPLQRAGGGGVSRQLRGLFEVESDLLFSASGAGLGLWTGSHDLIITTDNKIRAAGSSFETGGEGESLRGGDEGWRGAGEEEESFRVKMERSERVEFEKLPKSIVRIKFP